MLGEKGAALGGGNYMFVRGVGGQRTCLTALGDKGAIKIPRGEKQKEQWRRFLLF